MAEELAGDDGDDEDADVERQFVRAQEPRVSVEQRDDQHGRGETTDGDRERPSVSS